MMMFRNVFRKLFNLFGKRHKSYLITNAFCTLDNPEQFDVVKTCMECGCKEVLRMDKQTLLEVAEKFPNAFDHMLRSYIQSWKR
jgi:hypothetical protein